MAFDAYWCDMAERIYQLHCLTLLRNKMKRCNSCVTWATGILSCIFSWTWFKGTFPPAFCNAIIWGMQVVSIVFPQLRYGEIASALKFAIEDVQKNIADMERFWLKINESTSDNEIADARHQYNQQYHDIEQKYFGDISLKFSKDIMNQACDIRDRYLEERFFDTKSEVKM